MSWMHLGQIKILVVVLLSYISIANWGRRRIVSDSSVADFASSTMNSVILLTIGWKTGDWA